MRARRNRAFTLVEILIVVVILGILAAVVIPQFVNASDEAQVGNVETQLRTLRTQIQLFRAQSDDNSFPALVEGDDDAPSPPDAASDATETKDGEKKSWLKRLVS